MNKIILADSDAIFREGTAKLLSIGNDIRVIAQCPDVERMMHAIAMFSGAIVLFAYSLHPNMESLLKRLEETGSRAIVIAEENESATDYLRRGCRGVVFRSVTATALVECVRRVAAGGKWVPPQPATTDVPEDDGVGTRVLHRLSPKEMRIVALIAKGGKNREIAGRLKTTEQVVKSCLTSIYNKTGVSDRLELALFTIHHPVLAKAAEEAGNLLEAEERQANPTAVAYAT